MRRTGPVLLVLTGVLLPLALAGCSGDDTSDLAAVPVGTVLDTPGQVEGVGTFVQLPLGRVDLTVSSPRSDLPTYDETYDRAPEGGSLVGVGWDWDVSSVVPGMLDPEQPEPEPSFSLVADGEVYSLDEAFLRRLDDDDSSTRLTDAPLDFSGSAWVSVAGRPASVEIQVEYDGATQLVDPGDTGPRTDAGTASMLYSDPTRLATREVPCGDATVPGAGRNGLALDDAYCRATVAALPYRQGVGWAPEGEPWLVVDLRLDAGAVATWTGRGEQRAAYSVEELAEPLLSADGEPPASLAPDPDGSGSVLAVLPGDAAGSTLLVESAASTTDLSGGGDDGVAAPRDPTIPVTWSIELPAFS